MKFDPRDYQKLCIDDAVRFFGSAKPGDRRLYAAPTGSGKSVMELGIKLQLPDTWIIVPRLEIAQGMLEKLGVAVTDVVEQSWEHGITTPVRLRNRLMAGNFPQCKRILVDEAHHHLADTYQDLDLLLGMVPAAGFTATPYRGSPRSTAKFREQWGDPVWVISFREAVERGVISMPTIEVVPLVDDDLVEVSSGEFVVHSVNQHTSSRLGDAAKLAQGWIQPDGAWDVPTMWAVPSREIATLLHTFLAACMVPSDIVTGETPYEERQDIFQRTLDRKTCIIHINVVGEGVDLRLERLVDFAPMMSPVKWLQMLGRITRPGLKPQYVCLNRNILRHAYLLDGLVPSTKYAAAQAAFPAGQGKRSGRRAVGLEAIGRFRAVEIPFAGGVRGLMYALSAVEHNRVVQYCAVLHPCKPQPVWAVRENVRGPDGTMYGRWKSARAPEGLQGFQSVSRGEMSDKQRAWWVRDAARYGLDPLAPVDKKAFQVLPVLKDLGVRFT